VFPELIGSEGECWGVIDACESSHEGTAILVEIRFEWVTSSAEIISPIRKEVELVKHWQ